MLNALKILMSHGLSGYLILFTGFMCLMISLERLFYLYIKMSFNGKSELEALSKEILSRNYNKALQICNLNPNNPELKVIRDGLLSLESGREAMNSAISAAVLEVSKGLDQRLAYLSLIASSATLLGLFGTIMGLISTFAAIANADPSNKARLLGLGISEAMYSTAAGVIVGIFAMVVHTICTSQADHILGKTQNAALTVIKWIEQSERTNA
jgi:biopolymer transport protein ExbB/TolQ